MPFKAQLATELISIFGVTGALPVAQFLAQEAIQKRSFPQSTLYEDSGCLHCFRDVIGITKGKHNP